MLGYFCKENATYVSFSRRFFTHTVDGFIFVLTKTRFTNWLVPYVLKVLFCPLLYTDNANARACVHRHLDDFGAKSICNTNLTFKKTLPFFRFLCEEKIGTYSVYIIKERTGKYILIKKNFITLHISNLNYPFTKSKYHLHPNFFIATYNNKCLAS